MYEQTTRHIRIIVRNMLNELGLHNNIIEIGLDFSAGVGGRSLTAGQRQKINLARALLKRSDFLIMNRALSALDHHAQKTIIQNVIDWTKKIEHRPAIVAVLSTSAISALFERVIVLDRGVIAGDGTYDVLVAENETFKRLLS